MGDGKKSGGRKDAKKEKEEGDSRKNASNMKPCIHVCIYISLMSIGNLIYGRHGTLPKVAHRCFTQPGDVLLGMVKGSTFTCLYGDIEEERDMVENVEAFKYIIDQTNQDNTILPNITLGFVVLDMCGSDVGAISAATHFIPSDDMVSGWDVPTNCTYDIPQFKVAGVLGPPSSHDSIMLSPLLSALEIPVFSTYATSDELSNSIHSYFVRMSPSNKYQSEAILDILVQFEWTYFALLYSDDSYGRNGAKYIEQGKDDRGLCIGVSEVLYEYYDSNDIENIFDRLVEDDKLRVVVLFGYGDVLTAVKRSLYGRFVWVGSDGLSYDGYGLVEDGALYISFPDGGDHDFDTYMSLLTQYDTQNVYFRDYIQNRYQCTWDEQACNGHDCLQTCHQFENETLGDVDPVRYKTLDTTRAMILGLHNLFSANCPNLFQNASLLGSCLNGPDYLSAILNVSFDGTSGLVSFNEHGEMFGKYGIKQYSAYNNSGSQIGTWSLSNRRLESIPELINWTAFDYFDEGSDKVPDSVCSTPCPARHYYIQRELPCCWECFQCRDNEIIADNYTSCAQCPENTWPDDEEALKCVQIPPTYLFWGHPISNALLTLTCIALALAISVCVALIHGRNKKLVKASSRQLMVVILLGVLLELLTVFAVISRPRGLTCVMVQCGFFISVTLVYAPLFLKTNRVYRIFKAGMRGQKANFVSTRLMVVSSGLLILIQMSLTTLINILLPVVPKVRMPVLTVQYTELYCQQPPLGFTILLTYNLLLLLCCGAFGFLTRKLPENFNEAWYIFVSVSTTIFIWLVFLPAYFTAFYAVYQVAMLAACLLMNATITLLCFFVPKVYAAYYVQESKIKFAHTTTNISVAPSESNGE